jgi:hypothetical protein
MTGRAPSMRGGALFVVSFAGVADGRPGRQGAQSERAEPLNAGERGRSIFFGEHDREDTGRHGGIGWVGRAELGLAIIIIDFPKAADAGFVD